MTTTEKRTKDMHGWRLVLRALRSRNYRIFFIGQGTSLIGTWMQQMAMSWLVYSLTASKFYLGAISAATQIPIFFIAPFAGVLADRWSKHRMLIATQVLSMVQALLLAALVFSGAVHIWHLIVLSVFIGIINSFDIPTRQAFIYQLVDDKDDLSNAIALNSSIFNGARLAGPPIAGFLIAIAGEGRGESICFLLNALSFLAVLIALLLMRLTPHKAAQHPAQVLSELKTGLKYAMGVVPIRIILIVLAFVSLVGMPYGVLMPVFAKDVLRGGSLTLGLLMGAAAIGAIVGALYLAARKTVRGLGKIMVFSIIMFGIGVIAFSFSKVLWLSLLMLFLAGFGMMVQMASINTILQTIVDDDKRGRIMSLYTMAFMGMACLGALLAGIVANIIGAQRTLQISGCLCLLTAALLWRKLPLLREMILPIYAKKGIIPQVAAGIGAATQMTMETKE